MISACASRVPGCLVGLRINSAMSAGAEPDAALPRAQPPDAHFGSYGFTIRRFPTGFMLRQHFGREPPFFPGLPG